MSNGRAGPRNAVFSLLLPLLKGIVNCPITRGGPGGPLTPRAGCGRAGRITEWWPAAPDLRVLWNSSKGPTEGFCLEKASILVPV